MAKKESIDPMKFVKPGAIALGSFLGWRYVVAPLFETLGLKQTSEEKLMDKIENLEIDRDYWSASFYTKAPANHNALILSTAKANELAAQIKNAKSIWNDDESAIYAALRQCQYKTQVSYLVYWFNRLYALDLYTWLKDKVLNDKEMRTVLTITEKLPLGFKNLSTGKISGVGGKQNSIDLIKKYKSNGEYDRIKYEFKKFIKDRSSRLSLSNFNSELNLSTGDIVSFYGGYNGDILYQTEILGFDEDGEAYMLWDSYWTAIPLIQRKFKKIS